MKTRAKGNLIDVNMCNGQRECALLKGATNIIESFIRSCSHKLKSPLTSIGGLVMVAQHSKDLSEVKEYLGLIHQSAMNMIEMIHIMEEYMDNQKRELDSKEIKADQLVKRILEEEAAELQQHHIQVSTKIVQPCKWINDEHVTYVILKSLLENSIQYRNRNIDPKINIKIGVGVQHVTLEVSDNGMGIAEQEQPKIFEPFHKGSELSTGHGLGLFLVKGFLDKLKATISVSSKENIGTTFSISIPNRLAA
ncbi:MAG TPA: HAMP domain-containing sensor histidine kinase [Cyclobacteriaceae bacterium]|jgi:signal transduction histidine kinase|nr:HAMP domain-containing sensor histidine kinase [Cyclobacteriaceae bacterium]